MDVSVEQKPVSSNPTVVCCDPIFIHGIMTRSGTNFLYNLLSLHPDCAGVTTRDMPEDQLLSNSNLLERYANNVASFWSNHGRRGKDDRLRQQINSDLQTKLFESLGQGLVTYLNALNPDDGHKPFLTKTPNVRNLPNFFKLFPNARLIILIRDGRAVVESNVKSFGADYESTIQRLAEASRIILEFDREYRNSNVRYLIVKYEDIVDNFQAELSRVFEFLGLDPARYDFNHAVALPVFGSSENFNQSGDNRQAELARRGWKVVEKSAEFQPKSRWKNWTSALHRRFNWVAGSYMTQFGYTLESSQDAAPLNVLQNQIADRKWQIASSFITTVSQWEKVLYAIVRLKRDFRNLRMEP